MTRIPILVVGGDDKLGANLGEALGMDFEVHAVHRFDDAAAAGATREGLCVFDARDEGADWRAFLEQHTQGNPQARRIVLVAANQSQDVYEQVIAGRLDGLMADPVNALSLASMIRSLIHARKTDPLPEPLDALDSISVLNNLRSGVVVLDRHDTAVLVNNAAASILARPTSELLGKNMTEIFGPNFTKTPPKGQQGDHVHRAELTLVNGRDREAQLGYSTSAMLGPQKDNLGTIVVFADVTRENLLRLQLVQSEKMAGIGTLAGGIAHEFNNLIGGMLGYVQLAESTDDIEDYRRSAEVIRNSGLRAKTIIGNLLTFARRVPNRVEKIELETLVGEIVSLVERDLQSENIMIRTYVEPDVTITTDVGQLENVLLNLIINAKHAMLGGIGGTLTLRAARDIKTVRIDVVDTGVGIAAEHLPKIFEPFYSTKGSLGTGNVDGSGLGLSLSYGIMKELGGDILVKSRASEGSTFTLVLPIVSDVQPEKGDLPVELMDEKPDEAAVARILVVDDEPLMSGLLENVLIREGHQVKVAGNGYVGVEMARHFQPDIAIIDAQMPGMSGIETYEALAQEHPKLTVMMITGKVGEEYDQLAKEIDARGLRIIRKPFDIAQIRREIRSMVPDRHKASSSENAGDHQFNEEAPQ
ncbi:response regulator [bacterium]|nr:response regulator [bacterium]MCB9478216.1 response regulator [Deltaproteobacteria bacterium]